MKLSICMPTYNRQMKSTLQLEKLIREVSFLKNPDDVEIIVSDNCSTDNSFEELNNIKNDNNVESVKIIKQCKNLGLVGNLGFLFNEAQSKFIWFISDDDIILDFTIQKIIDLIDNKPNCDFFLLNFSTEENNILNNNCYFSNNNNYYELINDNTWGGFGLLSIQVLHKKKFVDIFSNKKLMKNLCAPVTVSFYGLFYLDGYIDFNNTYIIHHVGNYSWEPQQMRVFSIFLFDSVIELKKLGLDKDNYNKIKRKIVGIANFRHSSIKYIIKTFNVSYFIRLCIENMLFSLVFKTIKKIDMLNVVFFPYMYMKKHINYLIFKIKLKEIGGKSTIISPLHIHGGKNIEIGSDVIVQYKTWLAAVPLTNENTCILKIGSGSRIGHFNHIFATKSIIIEDKVLTADKVYISDNLHGFGNINIPIVDQPIIQSGEVIIGYGTWIGENACILGVKIGKNCVIGSNAVVTKNIPDYCIAVGVPAIIIKKYSLDKQAWFETDKDGNFLN